MDKNDFNPSNIEQKVNPVPKICSNETIGDVAAVDGLEDNTSLRAESAEASQNVEAGMHPDLSISDSEGSSVAQGNGNTSNVADSSSTLQSNSTQVHVERKTESNVVNNELKVEQVGRQEQKSVQGSLVFKEYIEVSTVKTAVAPVQPSDVKPKSSRVENTSLISETTTTTVINTGTTTVDERASSEEIVKITEKLTIMDTKTVDNVGINLSLMKEFKEEPPQIAPSITDIITDITEKLSSTTLEPKTHHTFSVVLANVRSCSNIRKRSPSKIRSEFIKSKKDIFVLTETWLKTGTSYDAFNTSSMNVIRCDRDTQVHSKKSGGGVAIIHKPSLSMEEIEIDFESHYKFHKCEVLLAAIKSTDDLFEPVHLVVVYKFPEMNKLERFIEHLDTILQKCNNRHVVMGDFNFPNINWRGKPTDEFHLFTEKHNMIQMVQHPTYLKKNTANILDLVFQSPGVIIKNLQVLEGLCNSDHESVHFEISILLKSLVSNELPIVDNSNTPSTSNSAVLNFGFE